VSRRIKRCGGLAEETYKVLEALDEAIAALREELGDLLLQVVLQTQIAIDEEEFRAMSCGHRCNQTAASACLWRCEVAGADDVTATGRRSRKRRGSGRQSRRTQIGAGWRSRGLPHWPKAEAIGGKAARQNFDWRSIDGVLAKVGEEIHEAASKMRST
jgi:tetrapyrrole methylase family protein/MazG family protein